MASPKGGKAVATDWKVIRVASDVLDALQEVRRSLWRAHNNGQVDGIMSRVDTITDNAVVAYLIRHYQKHRERRTRSRKKCKQARKVRAATKAPAPGLGIIREPPVPLVAPQ